MVGTCARIREMRNSYKFKLDNLPVRQHLGDLLGL
jgi:hypothetical protein